MRRKLLAVALAGVGALARGDQLLLMPTARRLEPGVLRGELWSARRLADFSLTAGIAQTWDAEFSIDRFGADKGRPTASFAYYYLTPIADLTPGVCAGVLDAAAATTDGRRLYACATLNRSLPKLGKYGYTELTAGMQVGRRSAPMAGFKAPVAREISLLAEYDGIRFNEGIEGRLPTGAYARIALRGNTLYVGFGFRSR
ncbi:MAG: hypothetical protein ACYC96_11210 [Fimbriimonadaceae bacterium]